jgi:hypothetical protein
MKIFLSGPMTGLPEFNRSEFNRVARILEAQGHTVLNPATLPDGHEYEWYMFQCFKWIDQCDAAFFLYGWRNSPGANREYDRCIQAGKITAEWSDDRE